MPLILEPKFPSRENVECFVGKLRNFSTVLFNQFSPFLFFNSNLGIMKFSKFRLCSNTFHLSQKIDILPFTVFAFTKGPIVYPSVLILSYLFDVACVSGLTRI